MPPPDSISLHPRSISFILRYTLLLACGLLGVSLIAYATHWGPVIYSDAAGYITIGQNILAGHGIGGYTASGRFDLLTYQPPFYPILLAGLGLVGANLVDIARWLNAVLFGSTVILVGNISGRFSGSSIAMAATCGVALCSPILISLYSSAMSEPLFIFLSLLGVVCLLRYIEKYSTSWLIWAALFTSLALMTRYAGAACVLAGSLAVLWVTPGNWPRKAGHAALFGVTACALMIIWLVWASLQPGAEPPRWLPETIPVLPRLNEARVLMVDIFWKWLPFTSDLHLPYRVRLLVMALLAAGLVTPLLLLARFPFLNHRTQIKKAGVLILYIVTYLVTLSMMFVYSNPPPDFDDRMFSLVYWLAILVVFTSLAISQTVLFAGEKNPGRNWLRVLPLAGFVLFASGFASQTRILVTSLHQNGGGYLSVDMRNSPLLQAIQSLPADIPLVSNRHTEVSFLTGRPCYAIMEVVQLTPQPINARFGDNPVDEAQVIFRNGGALVLFNSFRWQIDPLYYELSPQRVEAFTRDLLIFGEYADGSIYFYPTGLTNVETP
jgi:hypothetical protein